MGDSCNGPDWWGERRQTPESHWDRPLVGLLNPPPNLLAQTGPDRLDWRWERGLAWDPAQPIPSLETLGPWLPGFFSKTECHVRLL